MQVLWAEKALTSDGWQSNVRIAIDQQGHIASLEADASPEGAQQEGESVGILLPSPTNLHSHAFQRAMAGESEWRGPDPKDTFWTWRKLMYRFLDQLTPDDIEAITTFVQMEMLEAGYAAVCEFHYIHHQSDGTPYDDIGELTNRVLAASSKSGIGLTLLPVLYQYGGCDSAPLGHGQIRFGNHPDRFLKIYEKAKSGLSGMHEDCAIGVAPHSLRAVGPDGLAFAAALAPDAPIHIHIAEQMAEIEEVQAHWGERPIDWLFSHHEVDRRWCLIHATHMTPNETISLAKSGAVAGLCPITESNLGDGIFNASQYVSNGGRFGLGSDSNVRISLAEELRTLEYSQRLRDHARAVLATPTASTGRLMFDAVALGGAQAAGRNSGQIKTGQLADLVALDANATDLIGKDGDEILDAYIFAGSDQMITDVWAAGRHMVHQGRHAQRETITAHYQKTMASLRDRI